MALRTVHNMAKVLQKILSDGKQLHDPEVIQLSLELSIRSRSEQVKFRSKTANYSPKAFLGFKKKSQICVLNCTEDKGKAKLSCVEAFS